MFVCRACLRRGRGGLGRVGQGGSSNRIQPAGAITQAIVPIGHVRRARGLSSSASNLATVGFHPRTQPWPPPPPSRKGELHLNGTGPGLGSAQGDGDGPNHGTDADANARRTLQWRASLALQHLSTDPWHIANHIEHLLTKPNKFDEALIIVRRASSRDGISQVVVSWNHLIDYQLKEQRLHMAVKLFNEMKKRGQVPNALTYTILFRGFAASNHPKLALAEAVRIYNAMIRNEQRVRPNTIHMNAVLEVCSRVGDIESLFSVAATANDGLRRPNNLTFVILLNALRYDPALEGRDGVSEEQIRANTERNILRGLRVWEDISTAWNDGTVALDEELVCAMGRLLIKGDYKHRCSILDLVQQTMNIPRMDLYPDLEKPPKEAKLSGEWHKYKGQPGGEAEGLLTMEPLDDPSSTAAPVTSSFSSSKTPLAQSMAALDRREGIQPGQNTASLIYEALALLKKTSAAPRYWRYLTVHRGLDPDRNNYVRYILALARGNSSRHMADVLGAMPAEWISDYVIKIAMHACAMDNMSSPDAFQNACVVMDVMQANLRYPVPQVMRDFLTAARADHHYFRREDKKAAAKAQIKKMEPEREQPRQAAGGNEATQQQSSSSPWRRRPAVPQPAVPSEAHIVIGRQIIAALDRVWRPLRTLTTSLSYPGADGGAAARAESPEQAYQLTAEDQRELMATAARMVSATDTVLRRRLCSDPRTLKVLRLRRLVLEQLLDRLGHKRETMEAALALKQARKARQAQSEAAKRMREDLVRRGVRERRLDIGPPRPSVMGEGARAWTGDETVIIPRIGLDSDDDFERRRSRRSGGRQRASPHVKGKPMVSNKPWYELA